MSKIRVVAVDFGSPEGDRSVEACWQDGKLVSFRETKACYSPDNVKCVTHGCHIETCIEQKRCSPLYLLS